MAACARETAKTALLIEAPNVPIDAVRRVVANVRLVVSLDGRVVAETVVTPSRLGRSRWTGRCPETYRATLDNNGNADTDRLILS